MNLEEKLKVLPDHPGVYLMKDQEGTIIYVGKAINLKNRVRSYFREQKPEAAKTIALVKHIADFEYILVDNELEALVLECNLIKRYRPKYNISLKDDKTYPYLKITKEDYPQVLITRKVTKDGSRYFGPYPSVNDLRMTLEVIRGIFPFRSCKQKVFTNHRPCLNADIHRCKAPCVGRIGKEEYRAMIEEIAQFFDGKQDMLLKQLRKDMETAAERLDYEKAALLRDQIRGIENLLLEQKAVLDQSEEEDVIAMARGINRCCVQVFFVRGGKILGRENYFLKGTENSSREEVLGSFIKQFYLNAQTIPTTIVLEGNIEEQDIIGRWLEETAGHKVQLKIPKRGKQKELVEMVGRNALEVLNKQELEDRWQKEKSEGALDELQRCIGLKKMPHRMECYDISNTQGAENVASMVVFIDGQPKKDAYRRYKIQTVEGSDDYASMREVLTRRFKNTEGDLPDLILMDGGRGQVNVALDVLGKVGLTIPVCGMVKDNRHRTRGLYYHNVELPIIADSAAFYLITRMQDEAHRFAINYHRSLRGKRSLVSVLDDIPGVGEKRKALLLKHFGSFAKIKDASVESLCQVKGISESIAKEIYDYLQTHQDLQARWHSEKKG